MVNYEQRLKEVTQIVPAFQDLEGGTIVLAAFVELIHDLADAGNADACRMVLYKLYELVKAPLDEEISDDELILLCEMLEDAICA